MVVWLFYLSADYCGHIPASIGYDALCDDVTVGLNLR